MWHTSCVARHKKWYTVTYGERPTTISNFCTAWLLYKIITSYVTFNVLHDCCKNYYFVPIRYLTSCDCCETGIKAWLSLCNLEIIFIAPMLSGDPFLNLNPKGGGRGSIVVRAYMAWPEFRCPRHPSLFYCRPYLDRWRREGRRSNTRRIAELLSLLPLPLRLMWKEGRQEWSPRDL